MNTHLFQKISERNNMEYLVKAQDYLKLKIKDTYRVTNVGKEIAKKEGLNVEDLIIACLLHDVSDFEC